MKFRALMLSLSLAAVALSSPLEASRRASKSLGAKPYMGWSSWSLEATKYPGYGGEDWQTADHVKAQSDAMHRLLQKHGYVYVNLDAGWYRGYDAYGRPTAHSGRYPHGIAEIARYVHRNGQKLGLYYTPGINEDLYDLNPPIIGTPYHIQDIVYHPKRIANGWGGAWRIDYARPGAQAYIDSIASRFASWGADFLKLDGVTPGSDHKGLADGIDARDDAKAWSAALKRTGRPIWLEISWSLDHDYADVWKRCANGRRISDDVESYGPTLVTWESVSRRFREALPWLSDVGPGMGWNDLDSLDVGNGEMDGLTEDERRTCMTLWVIERSPLYAGDDLTKLDAFGLKLLTNDEAIAVDQAGRPAKPLSGGSRQVWHARNADGSETIALFNLEDKTASVSAKWADLGIAGPAVVRDLWERADMGRFEDGYSASLAPHASRLLRVKPVRRESAGSGSREK